MCTNTREITNKYTGKRVRVECGKCPACLQKRANRRASMIANNLGKDYVHLFVSLKYSNSCVPYIFHEDVCDPDVTIYRDSIINPKRSKNKRERIFKTVEIGSFASDNDSLLYPPTGLQYLRKKINGKWTTIDNKIGVLYFRDAQLFIKRVRKNLFEKYDYTDYFQYFLTGEYGETFARPHFHVLFSIPRKSFKYSQWRKILIESWPFNDYHSPRDIEIAKNPSRYLAKYVNSSCVVSPFLNQKTLRSRTLHSIYYGFHNDAFSFTTFVQRLRERNLTYDYIRMSTDAATELVNVPYPGYVSRRYFPKIKGYSRLNDAEICNVYYAPLLLKQYAHRLDYSNEDLKVNMSKIRGAQQYAELHGMDAWTYARLVPQLNNFLKSESYRSMFKEVHTPYDNLNLYDNIAQYYSLAVQDLTLNSIIASKPPSYKIYTNPNEMPYRVSETQRLEDDFNACVKQSKYNDYVYSHLQQ